jgi:hypothetical protein
LIYIKPGSRPGAGGNVWFPPPDTRLEPLVNLQKLFEKSENSAVAVAVTIFIVFHFGMLMLFDIVKF